MHTQILAHQRHFRRFVALAPREVIRQGYSVLRSECNQRCAWEHIVQVRIRRHKQHTALFLQKRAMPRLVHLERNVMRLDALLREALLHNRLQQRKSYGTASFSRCKSASVTVFLPANK